MSKPIRTLGSVQSVTQVIIVITTTTTDFMIQLEKPEFLAISFCLYTTAGSRFYPHITCTTCTIHDMKGGGEPRQTYVALLHVQADVEYRFSRTEVTSVMVNPNDTNSEEVTFSVYLPKTALISQFSM